MFILKKNAFACHLQNGGYFDNQPLPGISPIVYNPLFLKFTETTGLSDGPLKYWANVTGWCYQHVLSQGSGRSVLEYLRYLHQFHFMERCLSGSGWSRQFLRQFQLWYVKPGLSCRPTCRIGCRISNTRVIKLLDFVHWGSYYWRQPGRQAGGQQSLRQLLSSGLDLCPLALLQLLGYRAQLWVLGTTYGFNNNWEQAMDSILHIIKVS